MTDLPRLLYISDVPVAATVAGPALLYRLLQGYPTERLHIVESDLYASMSDPQKRLPGVTYTTCTVPAKRLGRTRLHKLYHDFLHLLAPHYFTQVAALARTFHPQAIVTAIHGFLWLYAAKLAHQLQIPLHIIMHDDWPIVAPNSAYIRTRIAADFARVYRQASSRLCVSPYMEAYYHEKYGVPGTTLYASLAADSKAGLTSTTPRHLPTDQVVFAYAGSIATTAYRSALEHLADRLAPLHAQLIVYSALTPAEARGTPLAHAHVSLRPLVPYQALIPTLLREADVLFVPMSFDPEHRLNMSLGFPSKITDYTATRLPLFIWGPPYCSAVRWAHENAGVAAVVDTPEPHALDTVVQRLIADADYRARLGEAAQTFAEAHFSHAAVSAIFYRALTQPSP